MIHRGFVAFVIGFFGLLGVVILIGSWSELTLLGQIAAVPLGVVGFGAVFAGCLYLAFGDTPALKSWDAKVVLANREQQKRQDAEAERLRLEEERKEARRAQGLRGLIFGYTTPVTPPSAQMPDQGVAAAQIAALSNPATAQALQELQKLRYTREISDAEFQTVKDKLLKSESSRTQDETFKHLEKLVELHQAGVLNDVEFTAAKLNLLDL